MPVLPHLPRKLPLARAWRLFLEFFNLEASGGIVLLACTAIALAWVNSPVASRYFDLWHTPFTIRLGDFGLSKDLLHWVNDGLMAIFFFVVGLEIKRELLDGELSSPKQAALPILAALGGMLVPAAIYLLINGNTDASRGWGIPMATDIAFAIGVLALLGNRVPFALKVFLTALAIADDIGAVIVIAIFYTSTLNLASLGIGIVILAILFAANRAGVRHVLFFTVLGVCLWFAFLSSGVHATVAGVLLAFTIPARPLSSQAGFLRQSRALLEEYALLVQDSKNTQARQSVLQSLETELNKLESPLHQLEHALHPWVTYVIMPIFALANAGVQLSGDISAMLTQPATLGVLLGLVLGKQVGITLFTWLGVKMGLASLPSDANWRQVYGVAWLGGIGFTMSLFIASLAFGDSPMLASAKVGILTASLIAGGIGGLILWRVSEAR